MADTRECSKCRVIKSLDNFHNDSTRKSGKRYVCKSCSSLIDTRYRDRRRDYISKWREDNRKEYLKREENYRKNNRGKLAYKASLRRKLVKKATPVWSDLEEIKYIYELAAEKKLHVDHLVPIKSKFVCGLNVPDNLRCISMKLNKIKGNRYWPDMPKELGGMQSL